MKSDWDDVSQNDRNAAMQFMQEIIDHFGIEFGKYKIETRGFGHQMVFNNYLLALQVEHCLIRIVCDREDLYVELAEPVAPELHRQPLTPNFWFDASVLTAYIEKSESFSWFYDDSNIPVGKPERRQSQLSSIANKMRHYWPTLIEMFGKPDFRDQREVLFKLREKRALDSWQALGWHGSFFSEQQESEKSEGSSFWSFLNPNAGKPKKIDKIVLGHFPEYVDKALETSSTYLGPSAQMWSMLKNATIRWDITKQFLDNGLKSKSTFSLATEVRSPKSYYARELQYLVSKLKPALAR